MPGRARCTHLCPPSGACLPTHAPTLLSDPTASPPPPRRQRLEYLADEEPEAAGRTDLLDTVMRPKEEFARRHPGFPAWLYARRAAGWAAAAARDAAAGWPGAELPGDGPAAEAPPAELPGAGPAAEAPLAELPGATPAAEAPPAAAAPA